MGDTFTPEVRSRIMRAVKGKDTSLEKKVRSALWMRGLRFRKNDKRLPGKPDVVFSRAKLAVFLDSCFRHGCPLHLRRPKSNQDYWQKKVAKNMLRDSQVTSACTDLGWTVLRIWEHEIKKNFDICIKLIEGKARPAKD
jgi:DNA mismatch endonuclease (patch repair protein)